MQEQTSSLGDTAVSAAPDRGLVWCCGRPVTWATASLGAAGVRYKVGNQQNRRLEVAAISAYVTNRSTFALIRQS